MHDETTPSGVPPLDPTVAELERHVAAGGWDQPPRLFALVDTAALRSREPALAHRLAGEGAWTAVEQDDLPAGELDTALAGISWPEAVGGTALVHEVVVLPSAVEAELPSLDPAGWAGTHPLRREVRMAVAVLRDGPVSCLLRIRARGGEAESLVSGPDLAPGLVAALRATLQP